MTERLIVIGIVCAVAVVVALAARRRPSHAPVQPSAFSAPTQLDRNDFPRADAPWVVVVFTSSTCESCSAVSSTASVLDSDAVAVVEVEVGKRPDLHERYGIEAVPICVVADAEGATRISYIGSVSATHLWGALAELRDPGSVPPGCASASG